MRPEAKKKPLLEFKFVYYSTATVIRDQSVKEAWLDSTW